jgi:hypothetical protein
MIFVNIKAPTDVVQNIAKDKIEIIEPQTSMEKSVLFFQQAHIEFCANWKNPQVLCKKWAEIAISDPIRLNLKTSNQNAAPWELIQKKAQCIHASL